MMADALKTLRPLYRAWQRDKGSETDFWQALIDPDAARLKPPNNGWPVLPLALLPGLYERLAGHGKRQGVYYTPTTLADFLTAQTLGRWLTGQYRTLCRYPEQTAARVAEVLAIKILDPACGTGVFLQQALQRLTAFYRRVRMRDGLRDAQKKWLAHPARYALTYQLYGVDIDEVALLLARTQLLRQAILLDDVPFAIAPGALNLQRGNALCLPGLTGCSSQREKARSSQFNQTDLLMEYDEEPAFSWEAAFPEVENGWDFMLGNPPYMTEIRGESGLLEDLRRHPKLRSCYAPKMDVCDAFLGLSVSLLRPNGQLGLVLPEYWMSRSGSQPVRRLLWKEGCIQMLWTFGDERLFDRAPGHHSSLLVWHKAQAEGPNARLCQWGHGPPGTLPRQAMIQQNPQGGPFILARSEEMTLLEKLDRHPGRLRPQEIQQGIVIPQGVLRPKDWQRLPAALQAEVAPGSGIFILSDAEVVALGLNALERQCLKPYYGVADFQANTGFQTAEARWIIYSDQALLRAMASHPGRYENLRRHLDRFALLNTSSNAPYGLHRARQPLWFEDPDKILCARQVLRPLFAQVAHPAYVTEGFYSLRVQQEPWRSHLPWVVACLNSTLGWFWFYHHKRKGRRLQIDKEVLLGFPLPAFPAELNDPARLPTEASIYELYGLNEREAEILTCFVGEFSMHQSGGLGGKRD